MLLQASLLNTVSMASSTDQHRLLNSAWGILADNTGDFAPRIKLATTSRALLPALLAAAVPVIITFYSSKLDIILKGISATPRGGEDAKIATLTDQICCLHLISALYSRLERHLVHGPSDVTKQAADVLLANNLATSVKGDGKDLSQFLVKCLSEKRSLVCPEGVSKELVKLYRAFHCASLNCMVAIICCIQDSEKIYDRYIFKEITAKQELLWSRIVQVETEVVFGMEQSEVGKRRRQVVAVRRSGADNRAPVLGHLQSHYLADSSLSQDVSRYDFTSSLGSGAVNAPLLSVQAGSDLQFLEVEDSEIGRHPCLPSLVACIRHMESKAMYPTTGPTGGGQLQPPGWMRSVLAVLQNPDTHRNVLLFLLKLVLSCPDTFLPFHCNFFAPILAILADGRLQGTELFIDYFTSDLLILLLSWTSKCSIMPNKTQEEKLSSSRILSFLIRHIHNDRRDILRHNLELVRSVIELWRPLTLDMEIVVDLLRSQESSGVQVLAILLINKLGDGATLSNEAIWVPLLNRLALKGRKDSRASAETIGLLLARLEGEHQGRLGEEVIRKMEKMAGAKTAEEKERFVDLLYHMHLHHPSIVVKFLHNFQYSLQHKTGIPLTQCLAMVRSNAKQLIEQPDNLATELRMMGIQQLLQRGDPVDQMLCLELLEEVVGFLDPGVAVSFLSVVAELVTHSDTELRKKSLALLGSQFKKDSSEKKLRLVCLSALLEFLEDADMEIQRQAIEVLTSKLPGDTLQMTLDVLSNFHLPGQESALLSLLPLALLSSASRAPSFSTPLFTAPLDTCEFNEHCVETDWRAQHQTALLPQFADTISSSQSQGLSGSSSQGSARQIQLLATQASTLEFQPTQASLPPSLASSLLALPTHSPSASNQLQNGAAPNLGRLQVILIKSVQYHQLH